MTLLPHFNNTQPLKMAIFDSGLGGLSVAKEVIKTCPDSDIYYIADNAAFPYGPQKQSEIPQRIIQILTPVINHQQPDIIIIACNTASTTSLATLRQHFPDKQFIGVVPAIKPACLTSRTRAIGVLGTRTTVEQPYTKELIKRYAKDCIVHLHASPRLVLAAENYAKKHEIDQDILNAELRTLLKKSPTKNIDTIVLACTHFPLLKTYLQKAVSQENIEAKHPINWVDSGGAIARRARTLAIELCSQEETKYRTPSTQENQNVKRQPNILRLSSTQPYLFSKSQLTHLETLLGGQRSIIIA